MQLQFEQLLYLHGISIINDSPTSVFYVAHSRWITEGTAFVEICGHHKDMWYWSLLTCWTRCEGVRGKSNAIALLSPLPVGFVRCSDRAPPNSVKAARAVHYLNSLFVKLLLAYLQHFISHKVFCHISTKYKCLPCWRGCTRTLHECPKRDYTEPALQPQLGFPSEGYKQEKIFLLQCNAWCKPLFASDFAPPLQPFICDAAFYGTKGFLLGQGPKRLSRHSNPACILHQKQTKMCPGNKNHLSTYWIQTIPVQIPDVPIQIGLALSLNINIEFPQVGQ